MIVNAMGFCTIAFFFVATTSLFLVNTAAPTSNLETLLRKHTYSQDLKSVPDPGIGDWFSRKFMDLLPRLSVLFKDPSNIKKFNQRFKPYRDFAETGIKFLEKYYSDETATMNIVHALKSFLAALDKISDGGAMTNIKFS